MLDSMLKTVDFTLTICSVTFSIHVSNAAHVEDIVNFATIFCIFFLMSLFSAAKSALRQNRRSSVKN